MKDIGLKLKEKREANGVSVEEAAEDLKMRPSQIESLENGNREEFKDVAMLKYFIRDYAKYLGLDGDQMVDEFNEYLFDFTSKIPVQDIEKAKEEKVNVKEIASPYTKVSKKTNKVRVLLLTIGGIILLGIVIYFVVSGIQHDGFSDNNTTYMIRR